MEKKENMITIDLAAIPAISASEAAMLVGGREEEFTKPGVYHVLVRDMAEEIAYLGDLTEIRGIGVPSRDGLSVEEDHVNFGTTEEYEVWVKIF